MASGDDWPELPDALIAPTAQTLRLMSQVVGKVRLARTPWINHSWHVTLQVSARGLATPLIPAGRVSFSLEFDFVDHALVARVTDGGERRVVLREGSIAAFYAEVADALAALGVATEIDPLPNELPDPVVFPDDRAPRPYDPAAAQALWRALVQIERVFTRFRSGFLGKVSPVHLFWGSFDLAVTRFSGRRAPLHPGGVPHLADAVTREAYSHEVSSAGFWAGEGVGEASFYSYAYPTPAGFADATVAPAAARFDAALGEFLLPYEAVRTVADPDAALLAFLRSTYAAAADLANWDRAALECAEGQPGVPRPVGELGG
ncbi:MAG TPA: DUF5996 family protein [Caulobacteraceae bacterium]|jgi:hypothetical protein|nr:DUF5996 family protein [Caulobacteraceae bacterium]